MREVASFMRMYPAYQLRDVLNEYAVVFFRLLSEGYRQENQHKLMLSYIALLPIMNDAGRERFLHDLEYASTDLGDILKPNTGGGATVEELKRMLG